MGFAVSMDGGAYEYSGDALLQLIGNLGNLVEPERWRMVRDLVRFLRTAVAACQDLDENVTLASS